MTKLCALCHTSLTESNRSKEHIIPRAIGGREKVNNFICRNCNSETGRRWDNELYQQLKPFCTMLGIKRSGKENQPVEIRGADKQEFVLNADASISIPHLTRIERAVADKTEVVIEAKTMEVARRILEKEARKRPSLDVEETLSKAISLRDKMQFPLRMSLPLLLSGEDAGRSIVKSCLGLAHHAGVAVDDCDYARQYLKGNGHTCFGHYNEIDLVKNRPAQTYFHCICVRGDPARSHILAYVEYFGCYRIVVRLSDSYSREEFNSCYAIDPVSGERLDLDIVLKFTQEEILEILANKRLDEEKAEDCLRSLLATCCQYLMITAAVENANAQLGVKSNQPLTEEQFAKWTNLVGDSLARALLGISPAGPLGARDVRANDEN